MTASDRIFLCVVRNLRWLARVPMAPQIFDSLLLAWVCVAHRSRLQAMEMLEAEALRMPRVRLRVHRFGGMEFRRDGVGELGHVHGHGLLDVRVGRRRARALIEEGRVRRHHVFPDSRWVSFQLENAADVPFAIRLLELAKDDSEAATR